MRRSDDWITELYYEELDNDKLRKENFYYDKYGDMVMTQEYHIKRGSCCGSGCKHCPYWPPYKKMNKELREDLIN